MTNDFLVQMFSNVGVPAAVCFYTFFQVNKNLEKLASSFDRWGDYLKIYKTTLKFLNTKEAVELLYLLSKEFTKINETSGTIQCQIAAY